MSCRGGSLGALARHCLGTVAGPSRPILAPGLGAWLRAPNVKVDAKAGAEPPLTEHAETG